MANEITVSTELRLLNGLIEHNGEPKTASFNQATARAGGPGTVDVGTSEQNIVFGDIVPGYVRAMNKDATNFVRLRFSATDNAIRLLPNNGVALFYLDVGVTLIAIADTAGCKVQFEAVNI